MWQRNQDLMIREISLDLVLQGNLLPLPRAVLLDLEKWEGNEKEIEKRNVLTKKRPSDAEDGEVSDSESDIGEFDDGLDDELMGDEDDRKRLEEMNEKEREEEIFKRAEKREMLKKRYEIEKKLKMQKKKSKEEERMNKILDTKERSRARKTDLEKKKTSKTSAALDEL